MTSKKVKLSGLFIGCLMVLSAMYMVMPASAKNTTTTAQMGLTVGGPAQSFMFDNDTKIVTFNVTVDAMTAVNITVFNLNGTLLSCKIQVPYEAKYHNIIVQETTCITTLTVGNILHYGPTNGSFVYLAVDKVTLTICISLSGWYNGLHGGDDGAYQLAGGSIQIKSTSATTGLQAAADPAVTSFASNLTANKIASGGLVATKMAVAADGWYDFKMNASLGDPTEFPGSDITLDFFQLGTGDVNTMSDRIANLYGKIVSVGSLDDDTQQQDPFYASTLTYLQKGQDYLIYVENPAGVIGYLNLMWAPVTLIPGAVNDTGMDIDFASSSLTIDRVADNVYVAYVDLGTSFSVETLYNMTLAAPANNYNFTTAMYVLDQSVLMNGMPKTYTQEGKIFILDNKASADISVQGVKLNPARQMIWMEKMVPGNFLGGLNQSRAVWDTTTVGAGIFAHQVLSVAIFNNSKLVPMPTLHLTVQKDITPIPAFPTTAAATLSKSNNGGVDDMGLYKLSGMQGKELDLTFSGLSDQINPTYQLRFLSSFDSPSYGIYGVLVHGGPSMITGIDNTSWSWSTGNTPTWDSPKVSEVAVFQDTVYVLVTGSWPSFLPDYPAITNTSSITITPTSEPFLNSKDKFVVSRDNQLQVYTASVSPCTKFLLEIPYGGCCSISLTGTMRAKSVDLFTAVYGHSVSLRQDIQVVWSYCTTVSGYFILDGFGSIVDGAVIQLTMTKVSSIPGFSIFFTILASFGIVAALIWKRRR